MRTFTVASDSVRISKEGRVTRLEYRGVETVEDEWGPVLFSFAVGVPGAASVLGEPAGKVTMVFVDESNDVLQIDLAEESIRLEFLFSLVSRAAQLLGVFPLAVKMDLGPNSSIQRFVPLLPEVSGVAVDCGAELFVDSQTFMAGCVMKGDDGNNYVLSFQVEDWVFDSPVPEGYEGKSPEPCFVIGDEAYYEEVQTVQVEPDRIEVRLVNAPRARVVIRRGGDGFDEFSSGVLKVSSLSGWINQ